MKSMCKCLVLVLSARVGSVYIVFLPFPLTNHLEMIGKKDLGRQLRWNFYDCFSLFCDLTAPLSTWGRQPPAMVMIQPCGSCLAHSGPSDNVDLVC